MFSIPILCTGAHVKSLQTFNVMAVTQGGEGTPIYKLFYCLSEEFSYFYQELMIIKINTGNLLATQINSKGSADRWCITENTTGYHKLSSLKIQRVWDGEGSCGV